MDSPGIYFLLFVAALSSVNGAKEKNESNYRLPDTIKPINYTIELTANPEKDTFYGSMVIFFNASKNTGNEFKIHVSPGHIEELDLIFLDILIPCHVAHQNNQTEIATIRCNSSIEGNNKKLVIMYHGRYSNDMFGFYKSTYDDGGVLKTLVATQFEEIYARRAFPCFDEPRFKATYKISIIHPKEYFALSNTRVESVQNWNGSVLTTFIQTPPISSYLIAFTISQFDSALPNDTDIFNFNVYSRPNAIKYTGTAVRYGAQLVKLLGNWTGLPYETLGNDKVSLIAIPDFAAGAMENWGLITYREIDLLDEAVHTSANSKQRIITTIAHELAHQWFGNYITMNWWSDTWLNEGFATYFENFISNGVDETLETDIQFVNNHHQVALEIDSLPSSDPLSAAADAINSPAEVDSRFNGISYSKGGSIIRMLRYIIGEENFQTSVRAYLRSHALGNTIAADFLDSIQSPDIIISYLNNWFYKAGYPLLSVTLSKDNSVAVIESQGRFLTTNSSQTNSSEWYIPVSYTTAEEPNFEDFSFKWLAPKSQIRVPLGNTSWIIVNLQSSGFYRVNYDKVLWRRIAEYIRTNKDHQVHVLNRAALVNDVFSIARIGSIDYGTAFAVGEIMANETELTPWRAASKAINYLLGKTGDPNVEKVLRKKVLSWIDSQLAIPQNGKYKGLKHTQILLQSLLLNMACQLGDDNCIRFVNRKFVNFKKSQTLSDYNMRDSVLCYGLMHGRQPEADFEFLFNIYKASQSPNEKYAILNALACTSSKKVLTRYLKETVAANSAVRKQDAAKVFTAVFTTNPIGVNVTLDFLSNNIEEVNRAFKGITLWESVLTGLAGKLTTTQQVDMLSKFIRDNENIEDVKVAGPKALDVAKSNLYWINTHADGLRQALLPERYIKTVS